MSHLELVQATASADTSSSVVDLVAHRRPAGVCVPSDFAQDSYLNEILYTFLCNETGVLDSMSGLTRALLGCSQAGS